MASIIDIVVTQRSELEARTRQPFVERQVPDWAARPTDLIRVILGPRRAGKSSLAAHLLQRMGGGGYVNFDDERLADLKEADGLLAAVDAVYSRPEHLLFDEVQNFPRWELLVNRLQREGRKLLVTGSNANLLGAELATHLTGRHQAISLLPFSFGEVLGAEPAPGGAWTAAARSARLARYLQEGGYPEPLLRGAPYADYLRDLVRATLQKDVTRRYRLRSPAGLEDLAHHLFSHTAQLYSYRTLAELGRVASPTTAEKYVRYLEEAFLVFTLGRFTCKARERAGSGKKVYAIDPGLSAVLGMRPGADQGRLAENAVACALWRKKLNGELDLGYWQGANGEEVDFVVRRSGRVEELIQVCWTLEDPRTQAREWRALLKASEQLRCTRLTCLHSGPAGETAVEWHGLRGTVSLRPLDEWLADS